MDFDAATVDAIVDRLSVLRARMLPKLEGAKKRNYALSYRRRPTIRLPALGARLGG